MAEAGGGARVRTGIFGGSFNPVHNGHIALARRLLDAGLLDEVWLVVSPQNPLKRQDDLLDDELRLEMARIAVQGDAHIEVSDYEFRLPRPSYMWHTLRSMSKDYPSRDFRLIIGADNWLCFDRWYAHKEILAHYGIIVYPRPGSLVDAASLPPNVRMVDMPLTDVSSTLVRLRLGLGEPIDGLVPPAVADFIGRHRLYCGA